MALPILEAGLNLLAAVGLGAAIGFERQWRQRLAGLRTNTLVALGAATFILFGRLAGDTDSAARVGAQVVSGIGFLGAGVIFKEGLNIRGTQHGGDPMVLRGDRTARRHGLHCLRGALRRARRRLQRGLASSSQGHQSPADGRHRSRPNLRGLCRVRCLG